MAADNSAASACPVDHKARDAWLAHTRAVEASATQVPPSPSPVTRHAAQHPPGSCALEASRITSTIPRSFSSDSSGCPVEHGSSANPSSPSPSPSNAEAEPGAHPSGNWVYPSEKMFFDAMKRKGYEAQETDMKTVVPIHNAVNERAWHHIQQWEAPYLAASQCGGPKLESFANKNDRMTPTARLNTILGYTAPFDRHDWVIDRCGTRVEYVIDFYAGRPGGANAALGPSFYLDVRPKLNTWEGVKMRTRKWAGLA